MRNQYARVGCKKCGRTRNAESTQALRYLANSHQRIHIAAVTAAAAGVTYDQRRDLGARTLRPRRMKCHECLRTMHADAFERGEGRTRGERRIYRVLVPGGKEEADQEAAGEQVGREKECRPLTRPRAIQKRAVNATHFEIGWHLIQQTLIFHALPAQKEPPLLLVALSRTFATTGRPMKQETHETHRGRHDGHSAFMSAADEIVSARSPAPVR